MQLPYTLSDAKQMKELDHETSIQLRFPVEAISKIPGSAVIIDFQIYLDQKDPGVPYAVQKLMGGVVNVTARATKINSDHQGIFPDQESVILKYAPPYIAGVGPDAKFDQYRQVRITLDVVPPHV